jgi:hypothetical protein
MYPLATLTPMSGKDSGFRIQVERDLREEFVDVCWSLDRPAAQVLREFMREFIASNLNKEKIKNDYNSIESDLEDLGN